MNPIERFIYAVAIFMMVVTVGWFFDGLSIAAKLGGGV